MFCRPTFSDFFWVPFSLPKSCVTLLEGPKLSHRVFQTFFWSEFAKQTAIQCCILGPICLESLPTKFLKSIKKKIRTFFGARKLSGRLFQTFFLNSKFSTRAPEIVIQIQKTRAKWSPFLVPQLSHKRRTLRELSYKMTKL